jgi:hypothetical protein
MIRGFWKKLYKSDEETNKEHSEKVRREWFETEK